MNTTTSTSAAGPLRAFFKPSINWLLVFIPVALALEHSHACPPIVFFSAALAIVPIAALIVRSTEQISTRTGDAIGGLLNATFGNALELIISPVVSPGATANAQRSVPNHAPERTPGSGVRVRLASSRACVFARAAQRER